jgi:hypothetical protein
MSSLGDGIEPSPPLGVDISHRLLAVQLQE